MQYLNTATLDSKDVLKRKSFKKILPFVLAVLPNRNNTGKNIILTKSWVYVKSSLFRGYIYTREPKI